MLVFEIMISMNSILQLLNNSMNLYDNSENIIQMKSKKFG